MFSSSSGVFGGLSSLAGRSHEHLQMRQSFAPREKSVLSRAGNIVRIRFDKLDSSRTTLHVEHPKAADIGTAMLVAQSTRHGNLVAMLFEELKMRRFSGPSHLNHIGTLFEDHNVTHALLGLSGSFQTRLEALGLSFNNRQQTRILQCGNTVPDSREIGLIRSERHERSETRLANEHDGVPALLARANQELAASSKEKQLTS